MYFSSINRIGLDKNLNKNIIDRSKEESANTLIEMYSRSDSDMSIFTYNDSIFEGADSYCFTFRIKNK